MTTPEPETGALNLTLFAFKLEHEDGTPADPPMLHTAVPTWHVDDTIALGPDRAFRVVRGEF